MIEVAPNKVVRYGKYWVVRYDSPAEGATPTFLTFGYFGRLHFSRAEESTHRWATRFWLRAWFAAKWWDLKRLYAASQY